VVDELAVLTSVTVTFTLAVAAPPGVPLMVMELVVLVLGVKPVGKPVTVHVYGPVPPVTETACEYGEPAAPAGRVAGAKADSAAFTTRL
jgi:hypothetical protein